MRPTNLLMSLAPLLIIGLLVPAIYLDPPKQAIADAGPVEKAVKPQAAAHAPASAEVRAEARAAAPATPVAAHAAAKRISFPAMQRMTRPDGYQPMTTWIAGFDYPHGLHPKHTPCGTCHHAERDRPVGDYMPCSNCHATSGMEDSTSYYRMLHGASERSCVGCHMERTRLGVAKPPLGCTTGCHKPPKGG